MASVYAKFVQIRRNETTSSQFLPTGNQSGQEAVGDYFIVGFSASVEAFQMELAMSNQTFISVGPYWDIIHRHRTSFLFDSGGGFGAHDVGAGYDPQGIHFIDAAGSLACRHSANLIGAEPQNGAFDTSH